MSVQNTTEETQDRRKKRAVIARFALAGVAVLGIGAAATSAAWTDDAWFTADAAGATFEIEGSLNGTTWSPADDAATAVVIPAAQLANLLPGQTRTFTIQIKNTGSVPAAIVTTTTFAPTVAANAFETDPTVTVTGVTTPLAAGASATATVTVTTPAEWAAANQGKAETLTIRFAGTATAP